MKAIFLFSNLVNNYLILKNVYNCLNKVRYNVSNIREILRRTTQI